MKNIYEILEELEITVPEEKKQDFETAFNNSYKTVEEVNKITVTAENYKTQLETAQTALKEFDGIDIKELNGKIAQLTTDLETKETEYKNRLADMEFNVLLDNAISKSGARNAKAVKALLDIEVLKASKNQTEDVTNAINAIKSENDYLFNDSEIPRVVAKGSSIPTGMKMSLAQAMKYANEHPDIDIKTLI